MRASRQPFSRSTSASWFDAVQARAGHGIGADNVVAAALDLI
ncbi:hypothetical protein [Acrocarpospora sp. B8E8]